jgi:L-amino acid N-acyltransferase YncA
MRARSAMQEDAAAIAAIYNQGIEDRVATFETQMRSEDDVKSWFDTRHPVVVIEEVGILEKHGKLDGVWRDVIVVERLIEANCT